MSLTGPGFAGGRAGRALVQSLLSWPTSVVASVAVVAAVAAVAVDVLTGQPVGLALIYLLPVSLAVWRLPTWAAGAMVACAAVSPLTDIVFGLYRHDLPELVFGMALRIAILSIVAVLLRALHEALDQQERLALTDPLTGVANGRAFRAAADAEIQRALRYGHPLSIVFADIDDFKSVNDQFGHRAGDEVLVAVAEGLKASVRTTDLVARVGGDEFVVLLPETGWPEAARVASAAHRVTDALGAPADLSLTVSVGAATFARPPTSVDELLERSDLAMYAAKESGKNQTKLSEI